MISRLLKVDEASFKAQCVLHFCIVTCFYNTHSGYYYLILTQQPGCLKYWYWDWRANIGLHYTGFAFADDTIVTLFMQYKSIVCFSLIEYSKDLKFYLSSLIFLRSSLVIVFKVKHPVCMCVNVY